MSAVAKERILALVAESPLPRKQALAQLGVARSTYYRWLRMRSEGRLAEPARGSRRPWNRLNPEEEALVLAQARASPELSPRHLALRITDSKGLYVSASTVYRILKREGLIRPAGVAGSKAARVSQSKTKRPHELWVTDCAPLKLVAGDGYYLVTVTDDFSRFILAWRLQPDMSADSLDDVIQDAIDLTGMTDVPIEDRTVLLFDNGTSHLSRVFAQYLRLAGIQGIVVSPHPSLTNDKVKPQRRTLKGEGDGLPDEKGMVLERTVSAFIHYHNYQRYQTALGDVTPFDVYAGRRQEVLQRREEAKRKTLQARRAHNGALRQPRAMAPAAPS